MTALVFKLAGGIGLFLLGIGMLTDGLKAFAGEALRRALTRFTGAPLKAFASGALVTAMVQSSSATTVTVIGFVSAGLLAFPQAVGVVMGASFGTTATGWIVAVLGLKVSVGFYALPLVGAGAFMRLLGRGRVRALGLALAGFGLIFVGIETLQDGMGGLAAVFNLARLPAGGFAGHFAAMAIGVAMTVVMQSSSAAVATTLTALHAGAVNFDQAASLVIGASVGTTVTGVLAAIGGGVPAKRTALAHVSFNLATGLIALAALPAFLRLIGWAEANLGLDGDAMSLAAFHTAFIGLGVVVFLPFAGRFAAAIERLIPHTEPLLTRHLDAAVLEAPAAALEAVRRSLVYTSREVIGRLLATLDRRAARGGPASTADLGRAIERIQGFLGQIPPIAADEPLSNLRVACMHAIDHLARLQGRLEPPAGARGAFDDGRLAPALELGRAILSMGERGLRGEPAEDWLESMERLMDELSEMHRRERPAVLQQTAAGGYPPGRALAMLDAIRWVERAAYHALRICAYLAPETPEREEIETAREAALEGD
ncbi:MAG: Na/Pi cotransporter family protein [Candidatus Latescibacterota bacterium]|nr:MAG: Na/Pi cotransporter family protein [Candidatus Latescibacterota bacterium]